MADGTLERETFADGTLRATDLAPAVTAVHTELCKWGETGKARGNVSMVLVKDWALVVGYLLPQDSSRFQQTSAFFFFFFLCVPG